MKIGVFDWFFIENHFVGFEIRILKSDLDNRSRFCWKVHCHSVVGLHIVGSQEIPGLFFTLSPGFSINFGVFPLDFLYKYVIPFKATNACPRSKLTPLRERPHYYNTHWDLPPQTNQGARGWSPYVGNMGQIILVCSLCAMQTMIKCHTRSGNCRGERSFFLLKMVLFQCNFCQWYSRA